MTQSERWLTRAEVREIDRRAIQELGIPGAVLMENAGRNAAHEALALFAQEPDLPRRAAILCGGGNNGGDGLAAARLLKNRGADVEIALFGDPERYASDAAINWRIVRARIGRAFAAELA